MRPSRRGRGSRRAGAGAARGRCPTAARRAGAAAGRARASPRGASAAASRASTRAAGGPARPRGRRSRSPARPRRARSSHALEPGAQLDELAAREEVVDRLVLGHVADPPVERRVPAHGLAEDAHRALRGRDQAGDRAQQRRLAGAVRPEQRRHARLDGERDVADRDDAAEPARQPVDDDRRLRAVPLIRAPAASCGARATPASTAVRPTSQSAETQPGTRPVVDLVARRSSARCRRRLRQVGEREQRRRPCRRSSPPRCRRPQRR